MAIKRLLPLCSYLLMNIEQTMTGRTPCTRPSGIRWRRDKTQLQVPGAPYPITDAGQHRVVWEIQSEESLKIKLEMWSIEELPEYSSKVKVK